MGATRNSREALGRASDGLGRLVAAPGNSIIELMTGGSPITKLQTETRQGLTDILYSPFRVAKHTAFGAMKGAGKLLWKGIANLPIFPYWRAERDKAINYTKSKLADLRDATLIQGKPPSLEKSSS